jgi:hypothetical protein
MNDRDNKNNERSVFNMSGDKSKDDINRSATTGKESTSRLDSDQTSSRHQGEVGRDTSKQHGSLNDADDKSRTMTSADQR